MKTDSELIYDLGGPTKVARMLGYGKGGTQRVFNWTKKGIPAAVKLQRPDLFLPDFPAAHAVYVGESSLTDL